MVARHQSQAQSKRANRRKFLRSQRAAVLLQLARQRARSSPTFLARKQREVRDAEAMLKATEWLNHRQRALIAHAVRHPQQEYSFQSHRRSHSVAYATARSDLLALAGSGLLVMRKRGKKMTFSPGARLVVNIRKTPAS